MAAEITDLYRKRSSLNEFLQGNALNLEIHRLYDKYLKNNRGAGIPKMKELDIFNLYLDGKTSKQIQEICAITSNTLKYHNANIYSKLGIKSRKELLTYAMMMKEKDRQDAHP